MFGTTRLVSGSKWKFASAKPSCKRCVASSAVTPYTSRSRRISVMIVCEVIGSSPAVGESYRTTGGLLINARAIETRRLIPPDNSGGTCSSVCSSSTNLSTSSTRGSISSSSTPSSRKRYATLSATVMESNSAPSWNTNPTWRRNFRSSGSPIPKISFSRITIDPPVGCYRPAASLSVSVFPVPVSPSSTTVSRGDARKERPRRISPSSKPMCTLWKLMTGAETCSGAAALSIGTAHDYSGKCAALLARLANTWSGADETSENFVGQIERKLGEKQIGDDDHHRRNDHRLRCGSPDSLRASSYREPFVAPHGRQDEPVHQRFRKPLHQIREIQRIDRPPPERHCIQPQGKH